MVSLDKALSTGNDDLNGKQKSIQSANAVNVTSRELDEAAKLLTDMCLGHLEMLEGVNPTHVSRVARKEAQAYTD